MPRQFALPAGATRALSAAALAGGAVFVALLVLVLIGSPEVDATALTDAVATSRAHPSLLAAARVITWFGSPLTVNLVCLAAAVLAAWRRHWTVVLVVVVSRAVTFAVSQAAKYGVDRPRAVVPSPLVSAAGPSFPSGHSSGIATLVVLAGAGLTIIAPALGRAATAATTVVLIMLALAVGATRVLLGVHYPSDVLAGLALGCTVTSTTVLAATALPRARRSRLA